MVMGGVDESFYRRVEDYVVSVSCCCFRGKFRPFLYPDVGAQGKKEG
jgi:hypothetical protein